MGAAPRVAAPAAPGVPGPALLTGHPWRPQGLGCQEERSLCGCKGRSRPCSPSVAHGRGPSCRSGVPSRHRVTSSPSRRLTAKPSDARLRRVLPVQGGCCGSGRELQEASPWPLAPRVQTPDWGLVVLREPGEPRDSPGGPTVPREAPGAL